MNVVADVELRVVAVRFEPIDIGRVEHDDAIVGTNDEAGRRGGVVANGRASSIERLAESLVRERLDDVVDRVDAKRVDRIAVERGDEHDRRQWIETCRSRGVERGEAVHARHLDVDQDDLGPRRQHDSTHGIAIVDVADNHAVSASLDEPAELLLERRPGSVFVVWTAVGPLPDASLHDGELVRVAGTPLGARGFGVLSPGEVTILRVEDGKRVPHVVQPTDYPPISSVVDAVLWLGPTSTEALPPPGTYADPAYVDTLRARARILTDVFGVDFSAIVEEAVSQTVK